MYYYPFSNGLNNTVFSIIPGIFILFFVIVLSVIIISVIRRARRRSQNNASPVLTVDASAVTKREDVHYFHPAGDDIGAMPAASYTTYFATFQVTSGDRLELELPDTEYGMLAEGDTGKLTFRGTRYLGFERNRM